MSTVSLNKFDQCTNCDQIWSGWHRNRLFRINLNVAVRGPESRKPGLKPLLPLSRTHFNNWTKTAIFSCIFKQLFLCQVQICCLLVETSYCCGVIIDCNFSWHFIAKFTVSFSMERMNNNYTLDRDFSERYESQRGILIVLSSQFISSMNYWTERLGIKNIYAY